MTGPEAPSAEVRATGNSTFALGMNLDYRRELFEGDPLRIATQSLNWDHKRLHIFHQMYHATQGFLAATNEVLFAQVSGAATQRAASREHPGRAGPGGGGPRTARRSRGCLPQAGDPRALAGEP